MQREQILSQFIKDEKIHNTYQLAKVLKCKQDDILDAVCKTIDSSGDYIALYPEEYSFSGVSCYIKNDEQNERDILLSIFEILYRYGGE